MESLRVSLLSKVKVSEAKLGWLVEFKKRRLDRGYAKRSDQGFEVKDANGLTFKTRIYLGLSFADRFVCSWRDALFRAFSYMLTSPHHELCVQVIRQ
eukprot:scaffold135824_cov15-Prasinocladus_malaysianus.AAC.1